VVGAVIEHRARLARWTVAAGRAGHPFSYAATGRWFGLRGLPRTIRRGPGAAAGTPVPRRTPVWRRCRRGGACWCRLRVLVAVPWG